MTKFFESCWAQGVRSKYVPSIATSLWNPSLQNRRVTNCWDTVGALVNGDTHISLAGSLILLNNGNSGTPRVRIPSYVEGKSTSTKQPSKVDHGGLESLMYCAHRTGAGSKKHSNIIAEGITCNILAYLGSALLLLRSISEPAKLMRVSHEIHTLA